MIHTKKMEINFHLCESPKTRQKRIEMAKAFVVKKGSQFILFWMYETGHFQNNILKNRSLWHRGS